MITIKRALVALALVLSTSAQATHVYSAQAHIDIRTDKVAHLETEVGAASRSKFLGEMLATVGDKGDRVILINSHGGSVTDGQDMINAIEAERVMGIRVICVVERRAHSMAFNLLSHCDVRLAVADALMIFHKVALNMPVQGTYIGPRLTAKEIRLEADDLDHDDEPYRQMNAKAMKMSLAEYDDNADKETVWQTTTLIRRGYLQGLATIEK